MAAARIKQLEDKLANYESIMSDCRRCKAILASKEVENAPSLDVATTQAAPKLLSNASALLSKESMGTTRHSQSGQPSKQSKSASRSKPPPRDTDAVDPNISKSASARRLERTAAGSSRDAARPSSRLSKQSIGEAVPSLPGSSSTHRTDTAHSLQLRPTSLRPSTSRINSPSADINQLNTAIPSLFKSGSSRGRPRHDPQNSGDWVVSANIMLGEVPLGWVWQARLLGVDKSMLAAVAIDTTTFPENMDGAVDETQNKDTLLNLVRGFAHRHSAKRINFQQFLLVCLCQVVSAMKVPQSSIVEVLQICISDTVESNIGKYLKGAKWANELMDRLFFTSWRYRAVDLMVLWDRSIAMYGRIASAIDLTIDYFVTHLTQSEYCVDVEDIPDRVHTTIPWIVKKEFGDGVSYETVCKALGYSNEYISETQHLHSSTRSSPESDIPSSEDEGSASTSQPFHSARPSADSVSSTPQLNSTGNPLSSEHIGAAYLRAWTQSGRKTLPGDVREDLARRDAAANQTEESHTSKRMIPDRSAQPLGDAGESAPTTQSSKRPHPDSPTSQLQSENAARRRQDPRESPSREETGSSSRHGKKDSHRRRDRA